MAILRAGRGVLTSTAVALLACASLAATACSRTNDYRIKVTVEIDDNGVLRTGSAVSRLKVREAVKGLASLDMGSVHADSEAVVVPMGDGPLLVAVGAKTWPTLCGSGTAYVACQRRLDTSRPTEPAPIAKSDWPTLVAFSDPTSPSTARIVPPDDLEGVYGRGVTLRSVTVAVTRERVTRVIQKHLPWTCQPIDALFLEPGIPDGRRQKPISGSALCMRFP